MITDQYMAGEDPIDLQSASKLKDVVRKAVNEYMNKEMVIFFICHCSILIKFWYFHAYYKKVSTNWITNLQYVAQTCRVLLDTGKVKGFVQKLDVSSYK